MLILDGPVGTELTRRGIDTRLPLWSAAAIDEAPEVLRAIHADYVAAGAGVHVANTFRTQPGLMAGDFARVATRAVSLARQAGAGTLAGSLAPVEDCYRPDLSPGSAALPAHAALAKVLAQAGSDLLLCETFPHEEEAWAATEAAVATGLPTWTAFTAGPEADLMTPSEMQRAAKGALERGAERVLVNCTRATACLPFVEALAALGAPVGVYGNAGRVDDELGWESADVPSAARYADIAASWVAAGATAVGGCCGTGPVHIAELARRFSARRAD